MSGHFDLALVSLSYIIAVIASFTALELARRVATTDGVAATAWHTGGAIAMGIGIWTMHFVGMLAFSMDVPFTYDIMITVLSLLVGILAAAFAIFAASRKSNNILTMAIGGIVLGFGIAAMHYTGMEAMEMAAVIIYDPLIVAVSVLIAIVAAFAAIWIAFAIANSNRRKLFKYKLVAAMVMGIAICGMHYTGMYAASYQPVDGAGLFKESIMDNTVMAVILSLAAVFILGVTHLTIFFDYRLGVEKQLGEKLSELVRERTIELLNQTEDLKKNKSQLEHEIEERGRAEQETVHLSTILDESLNEIYVFDVDTLQFLQVNRGSYQNLGYTKEELLAKTPLDLKPEFSRESFEKLLQPLRSGEKQQLVFETVHKRADNTLYPTEVHLQLSKATGKAVFVALIKDITERKNLESQLVQAKKLESIGQLAAGIAHEINTPAQFVGDNTNFLGEAYEELFGINAVYEELCQVANESGTISGELMAKVKKAVADSDLEYLKEEIPRAIAQAQDGVGRISTIVKAMKEFSHPGTDKKDLVDLNKSIDSTITVASNEWKYVAELETGFYDELPQVMCSVQEINQVILNLIVNAAHAIKDVMDVSEESFKGKITVNTAVVENMAEIRISDNGKGIPEDIRERVFDPFFTTKEVGKGTGQGLAIAYTTIVEQHKGTFSFESDVGVGTTFIIRLPLPQTKSSAEPETFKEAS